MQVEAHNGTSWDTQAEMAYNGLGQRLSMDAAGVIAQYVIDGDRPLTAESGGNSTFFLYGLGPIGEKTSTWNFALPDGLNTPRQLTDTLGEVTLSVRYAPWGGTLDSYGTGNFTYGYLGGILDVATDLIYVGNGQYYDPSTGRFLTRGVNPNSTNPYVPWNPIGAILGPLGLISLIASRRKKGSKANPYLLMFVMLVVLPVTVGIACSDDYTPTPSEPVNITATVQNEMVTATATVDSQTYTVTAPVPTLSVPDCAETAINNWNDTFTELVNYANNNTTVYVLGGALTNGTTQIYMWLLINEARLSGQLNTDELAYILATAHLETRWYDLIERYDGVDEFQYFEAKYGKDTIEGKNVGNINNGDGFTYRGRGFVMLTGRYNYAVQGLENNPNQAADPATAASIAVRGMTNGSFRTLNGVSSKLSNYNTGTDGYDFFNARDIINADKNRYDGQLGMTIGRAAEILGEGYAGILSRHCGEPCGLAGITCR